MKFPLIGASASSAMRTPSCISHLFHANWEGNTYHITMTFWLQDLTAV